MTSLTKFKKLPGVSTISFIPSFVSSLHSLSPIFRRLQVSLTVEQVDTYNQSNTESFLLKVKLFSTVIGNIKNQTDSCGTDVENKSRAGGISSGHTIHGDI